MAASGWAVSSRAASWSIRSAANAIGGHWRGGPPRPKQRIVRLTPKLQKKRMAASAEASRKSGKARGTGRFNPGHFGVSVKLPGAPAGVCAARRDWLNSLKKRWQFGSVSVAVSRRADSAW